MHDHSTKHSVHAGIPALFIHEPHCMLRATITLHVMEKMNSMYTYSDKP